MALPAGTRLAAYEVLGLIGAGGMGEVYKARDTRLDRTVALKVLPPEVAADPERRARFEREAHVIAALSDPHICTLHDIGTENGTTYLVMEHLVGETLAERLAKGPLALAVVLDLGAQIAGGLAAAHKAGIVHRDLKPANIMLVRGSTASGPPVVKLLDFGLAKLTAHGEVPAATLATTAALPASLTGRGTIVGTLPYMAPEQVQGQEADARTDIWALGAILYEMVSGARAFEASSATSLIGAILEREPAPLAARHPRTPPSFDRTVRRCLAKHPDDRWYSAHDLSAELRWIADVTAQESPAGTRLPSWRRTTRTALASALIGGVIVGMAVWTVRRPSSPKPVVRSQLDVQPADDAYSGTVSVRGAWTRGGSRTAIAWTPNGRTLVFIGRRSGVRQLYARDLDRPAARPLAGTEGAQIAAVSPDGKSVVFWAQGEIRRVPLDGGPAQTLLPEVRFPPFGMAVDVSGRVFWGGDSGGIWHATSGSARTFVTSLGTGETEHVASQVLANDTVLLFTVRRSEWTWGHEQVVAQVLTTGERKLLLSDAADARYVTSGHLVFLRRGLLMAVPFDVTRLAVTGAPVAVLDNVAQAVTSGNSGDITGAGQFSVSAGGDLAYVPSPLMPYPETALVTVDRQGQVTDVPTEKRSYAPMLHLSPDGHRLAVSIATLTERALWSVDLTRGSVTKLTGGGEVAWPRWTPDHQRIAFSFARDGVPKLVWQQADGSAGPTALAQGWMMPSSWSPDGRHLATVRDYDLWVVTVGSGEPTITRLTETAEAEMHPEFSPDGHWMAYTSNTTGRNEVYLKPVSASTPVTPVSLTGGQSPAWNPRGGELFFVAAKETEGQRLMAVPVKGGRVGPPVPLFDVPTHVGFGCVPVRCYDVTPDGQRFVVTKELPRDPPTPVTHINVVLNWVEELKAKVPVTGGR